ncbi:MAG: glycosyltransferase [Candidatus Eremiobacteraeota bacterium]|nr:glycosyltransferase [Candidatus Eremiobacteraeota bacterium]MBC5803954.1 glycosyltransferase [Candidatus Eremiobacteraeota bacterium]MBC5824946.1 glycosyltransferase [Candidatus Eremiobacteraeota bacterium]
MGDEEIDGRYRFSVCICTRNRPDDLTVALSSIAHSRYPVWQTVVSDDSTDDHTATLVTRNYPGVTFIEGPRRGLSANRNAAAAAATGTHVVFIDDDAALGQTYLEEIAKRFDTTPSARREKTIVSGIERLRGNLVYPNDISFVGFQSKRYEPGHPLRTFIINATAFPIGLLRLQGFDENLVYGSDEVDFAVRSVACGFEIVLAPAAVNDHYSSAIHREEYESFCAASRMYTTFKRYWYIERKPLHAILYAFVGPIHFIASAMRAGNPAALKGLVPSMRVALGYLKRYRSAKTDMPVLNTRPGEPSRSR